MTRVRGFRVLFAAVPLLALCGCGNYNELSNMDLAAGMAVDRRGGEYALTVEIMDLSGSPDENTATSYQLKATGSTVSMALENARRQLSKSIHMGNMEIIVISEEIARDEGLSDLLDWFERDTDVRESVDIVIARGGSAEAILTASSADTGVSSHALEKLVHPSEKEIAQTVRTPLYRITEILNGEGKSLVLPAVGLTEAEEPLIDADGLAVFRHDKLTGYLEQSQITDFMLLTDHAANRVFVFDSGGKPVTLSVSSVSAGRGYTEKDGQPAFHIEVKVKARVDQLPPGSGEDGGLSGLKARAEECLERELQRTVRFCQTQLESDIFGLGQDVYLKDKALWDELGSSWEREFERLDVDVNVSLTVLNTGQRLSEH